LVDSANRSAPPPVDIAAVADADDQDEHFSITNLVEDAVLADPDPPESVSAATRWKL
jgi:hypothetical protein